MESPLGNLELTSSWERDAELIEDFIRQMGPVDGALRILEAGCGQSWSLRLDGVEYVLTGVDSDSHALDIRKNVMKDLDVAIVGDLRTVEFDAGTFDVIYNAFVLEHIHGAENVLNSFVRWLKPGGLIVIRIPDPDSVQGFVTRVTPHWFHIFYYRYLLKKKTAGLPGYAPFRTYYDSVVSRQGVRKFCEKNNLSIAAEFGDGYIRPGEGMIQLAIGMIKQIIASLSLGKLSARHTNLLYVLQLNK
ncbi:Methyltransferase domain-containing protein [Nitrosospira briensis]|uniref:Methyltransferase domain-containing protein n=1 Tax=Nitrosospira briensis TaxID=35799 RepID=A0A1I5BLT8_9PROT|nr:Methyltransferase domain-containing protein [Nitrosospira briensis]